MCLIKKYAWDQYDQAEVEALFRQTRYDMRTDYEFVDGFVSPFESDSNEYFQLSSLARISLYFKKIDNNTCKEITTGLIFKRYNNKNGQDVFYNEKSGLYFGFRHNFERAIGHEGFIHDAKYYLIVQDYFNYYINLKNFDDKNKSEGLSLLLKNNINYTRKDK